MTKQNNDKPQDSPAQPDRNQSPAENLILCSGGVHHRYRERYWTYKKKIHRIFATVWRIGKSEVISPERVIAYSAAITAVATATYAVFAYLQWAALNQSVQVSQRSVWVAAKSAQIAEQNSRNATEQFRLDQRAWVSIEQIVLQGEIKGGQTMRFAASMKNTGKTPALNVTLKTTVHIAQTGQPEYVFRVEKTEGAAIGPGGGFVQDIRSSTLTQAIADGLESGRLVLTVHIQMTYNDAFVPKTRHTTACGLYKPEFKPLLKSCVSGNYYD